MGVSTVSGGTCRRRVCRHATSMLLNARLGGFKVWLIRRLPRMKSQPSGCAHNGSLASPPGSKGKQKDKKGKSKGKSFGKSSKGKKGKNTGKNDGCLIRGGYNYWSGECPNRMVNYVGNPGMDMMVDKMPNTHSSRAVHSSKQQQMSTKFRGKSGRFSSHTSDNLWISTCDSTCNPSDSASFQPWSSCKFFRCVCAYGCFGA